MSWFLMDREIFNNYVWKDVVAFRLFFFLIGNAVFKEQRIGPILIKRGQLLRSYRKLQEDLLYEDDNQIHKYSTATIQRAANRLKDDNRIYKEETASGTLFTVINYEKYQDFVSNDKPFRQPETPPGESSNGIPETCETLPKQLRNNNNQVNQVFNYPPSGGVSSATAKHPIWGDGVELLMRSGVSETSARAFLGRAVKDHGEGALSEAISATLLEEPVNPKAYLLACLKPRKTSSTGHQRLNGNEIVPSDQRKGGLLEI